MSLGTAPTARRDGAALAIFASRFDGVVAAMLNTLFRTSRSGVINTARDCSCCIVTAADELLVTGEALPIHVMSGPDLMTAAMKAFHPQLRRGDAFLHNSPYHGNSHAADHTILVPVIDDDGVHRATVFAKAHLADCGNSIPTTYHAGARDVYEEGALIFPCVKVQSGYEEDPDWTRLCQMRLRVPDLWRGDFLALLGSARIGERKLLELGRQVGWDALDRSTQDWFDYSEVRMATALERLPEGEITSTTMHDPTAEVPEGVPLRVTVRTDPATGLVTVDLRDNPDCLPCGLNLTEATARTAAMIGVFSGLEGSIPKNAGSFRRIDVLLREGCVVGIPTHPASCSVATTNVSDRLINCVQAAFAQLGDGLGRAASGMGGTPSAADISGVDPRTGRRFQNEVFLATTCGGAGPTNDGWLTELHPGGAGMLRMDSVEVDELRYPIRVDVQRLEPDTEGPGRHRGALGARVEFGPVGCSLHAAFVSDGSINPPEGVRGGDPGGLAQQFLRRTDGAEEQLDPFALVEVADGERLVSISNGGGGYGPARERDRAAVHDDVVAGLISEQRARDVYGFTPGEGDHA